MLYWGLRQTSDRKAAPKNDGHLGYTNTLNRGSTVYGPYKAGYLRGEPSLTKSSEVFLRLTEPKSGLSVFALFLYVAAFRW